MIAGLIVMGSVAAYTTGAMAVGRHVMMVCLEDEARKEQATRNSRVQAYGSRTVDPRPLVSDGLREEIFNSACWAGVFWWAVLIYWLLDLGGSTQLIPPTERARLDQLELARLREQAKRLDLPMGDES